MKILTKKGLLFYLILSLLFFISCEEDSSTQDDNTIEKIRFNSSAGVLKINLSKNDTNNLMQFDSLFNTPKIINLRSKDSSFFVASIEKMLVFNNQFFIFDDRFSNLLRFDSSGNYINNYGKIGLGKEEYNKINDFDIDTTKKQIIIFSNTDRSLYYYNLETGKFIKKLNIHLYGSQICTLPNNQVMLYRNFSNEGKIKTKDYNTLIIDSTGKTIKKAFPFDSKISFIEWRSSGFLKNTCDGLFYMDPFTDTIYKYANNNFEPFIETNILSENIKSIREDHDKLYKTNALVDTLSKHMGATFLKNKRYTVFNYITEKRTKTVFYDLIKNTYLSITAKYKLDPLIACGLTPIYLQNNNTIFFKINQRDILRTRSKYPELFKKLPLKMQNTLSDSTQKTGTFLLTSKIKAD